MSREPRSQLRLNVLLAAGGLLLLGVALWLWQQSDDRPREEASAPKDPVESLEEPAAAEQHTEPRILASAAPASEPQQRLGSDGVPIMGARDDSTAYGPRHPHPITPEHRRIFRENGLIGSLNGAMDVGDFAGLRRLNEQYKSEYPEDAHLPQAGYDIIADCLEQRTPENRARAERFFNEERASTLRRYVRRHCLQ
jgi:hypothetical protein